MRSAICYAIIGDGRTVVSRSQSRNIRFVLMNALWMLTVGSALLACKINLTSAITTSATTATTAKNNDGWFIQYPLTRRTNEATASSMTTVSVKTTTSRTSATSEMAKTTPPVRNETTSTTLQSTTAMGNVTSAPMTNGTSAGTISKGPTGQQGVIPSFQVTNSEGEVCMLFKFSAVLKIRYETTSNGTQEAVIPLTKTSEQLGWCVNDTERNFSLLYPKMLDYILIWAYRFQTESQTAYSVYKPSVLWIYQEPVFSLDAVNYGKQENIEFTDMLYKNGTIGKSFKCKSLTLKKGPVTVLMKDVLFDPYADRSTDKGHLGDEVEVCPEFVPTTSAPHTTTLTPGPYQMNIGEVIGITAGALVAVGLAVILTTIAMKRRRQQIQYGNI